MRANGSNLPTYEDAACDPASRAAYCGLCKLCGGEQFDTQWCRDSERGPGHAPDAPCYDPDSDHLSDPFPEEFR